MENFKCKECNKILYSWRSFSHHIRKCHNGKHYYDKYIKNNSDGICKICGKETVFISIQKGYQLTCKNKRCLKILKEKTKKETNLKIYGVENVFQNDLIKNKCKETKNKKYGDENYSNREKSKQTCIKKFGVDTPFKSKEIRNKTEETNKKRYGKNHPWKNKEVREKGENTSLIRYGNKHHIQSKSVKEKSRQTCLKHYGTDTPFKSKDVRNKIKQTCLERYGVENVFQSDEIRLKWFKSGLQINQYKDTSLNYQGTYELDFLENYYEKVNILNGPKINYVYENNNHVYFPDFFISDLNLIIEIKSNYFFKKDEKIKEKEYAVKKEGYNYILILDKQYAQFNKLLNI